MTKNQLFIALMAVLFVGGGYVMYSQRPVMLNDYESGEDESISEELGELLQDEDDMSDAEGETKEPESSQNQATNNTETAKTTTNATIETKTEPKADTSGPASYTLAEVSTHGTKGDCWTTIGGDVYDLTSFVERHPGGPDRILKLCGTDGTAKFTNQHGKSSAAKASLALLKIGILK